MRRGDTPRPTPIEPSLFVRIFDGTNPILVDSEGKVALIAYANSPLKGVYGDDAVGVNKVFNVMNSEMQAAIVNEWGSAEYPGIDILTMGEQTVVVNGYTYTANVSEFDSFRLSPAVENYNE